MDVFKYTLSMGVDVCVSMYIYIYVCVCVCVYHSRHMGVCWHIYLVDKSVND